MLTLLAICRVMWLGPGQFYLCVLGYTDKYECPNATDATTMTNTRWHWSIELLQYIPGILHMICEVLLLFSLLIARGIKRPPVIPHTKGQ